MSVQQYLALQLPRLTSITVGCDPRHYQLAAQLVLLSYGIVVLDFSISLTTSATVIVACLLTQHLLGARNGLEFDPCSATISALSLCLLLRTDSLALAAFAATIAIASKFLVRIDGRHIFNPTALSLVVVCYASSDAWLSPGQWGPVAMSSIVLLGAGLIVLTRASRLDITLTFFTAYAGLVFGRALWLGDPLQIPLHHLGNGALVLFALFMLPDPRSTPYSRAGRIVFAIIVAGAAASIEFALYRSNGPILALTLGAPLVPVLDRLLPAPQHSWRAQSKHHPQSPVRSHSHGVVPRAS